MLSHFAYFLLHLYIVTNRVLNFDYILIFHIIHNFILQLSFRTSTHFSLLHHSYKPIIVDLGIPTVKLIGCWFIPFLCASIPQIYILFHAFIFRISICFCHSHTLTYCTRVS